MADDWITPEDVAAYLDEALLAEDDNLLLSTAAVKAAVEGRRSDLNRGDPPVFTPPESVRAGAIMWASILYQARSAGQGVSDFGDATGMFDPLGARRAEVMRLVGWRRPLAV